MLVLKLRFMPILVNVSCDVHVDGGGDAMRVLEQLLSVCLASLIMR
jgi:hypothetical protein